MPAHQARRVALVTGANRGIGSEACRALAGNGLSVILTARRPELGRQTTQRLAAEGLAVRFEHLDVADPTSVADCVTRLTAAGTAVDVLVNNAGLYPTTPVLALDEDRFFEALQVNLLGAWRTCRAFVPVMRERGYGRVVNVSSGDGAICGQSPGTGAYGITKTALNALTRVVATEAGPAVKVNAMCPGWVATDMGGPGAPVSPAEATDTLVWLATLPEDGPTNGFFRNRQALAW